VLGRPLPGALGFLGLGSERRRRLAEERESSARALAGRLGLAAHLDTPLSDVDDAVGLWADTARALLGEPRAVVALAPSDEEVSRGWRSVLAAEAARRRLSVLVLRRGSLPPRPGGPG
jgi:hypothetical protein